MSTYAISMVKNEQDIIEYNIRWLLSQVDHLIVSDNLSTDGTLEILQKLANQYGNITLQIDKEIGYYQADKMNAMAKLAGSMGAEWVIPFDADELWYSQHGRLKDVLAATKSNIVECPVWHMVDRNSLSHNNHPVFRMEWRQENNEKFPVVAYRYHPEASIHMGNHDVSHPDPSRDRGTIEVRHFQYRSLEQFKSKVRTGKAAYDATDFDMGIGFHWRNYGSMSDSELESIWIEWTEEQNLIFDPWTGPEL